MSLPELTTHDALVIVDVQNDFCPGGALAVEGGDEIIPVLNRWIEAAQKNRAVIVASRDWHPPDHVSFKGQGGPWPIHCVQMTRGAELHPDLNLPPIDTWNIAKGSHPKREQYSLFDGTDVADRLNEHGVQRLWVGGLALDVCVRATVLDALKAGFEVHLIRSATRAVNASAGDGDKAIAEMREAGAIIEEGNDAAD